MATRLKAGDARLGHSGRVKAWQATRGNALWGGACPGWARPSPLFDDVPGAFSEHALVGAFGLRVGR